MLFYASHLIRSRLILLTGRLECTTIKSRVKIQSLDFFTGDMFPQLLESNFYGIPGGNNGKRKEKYFWKDR